MPLADALDLSNRFFQQSAKSNWKRNSNLLIDALCERSSSERKRRSSNQGVQEAEPGSEFKNDIQEMDKDQQDQLTAFYRSVILKKNVCLSTATINNGYFENEPAMFNRDYLTGSNLYNTKSLYNASQTYRKLHGSMTNYEPSSNSLSFTRQQSYNSTPLRLGRRSSTAGGPFCSHKALSLRQRRLKRNNLITKSCYAESAKSHEFRSLAGRNRIRHTSQTQSSFISNPIVQATSTVGSLDQQFHHVFQINHDSGYLTSKNRTLDDLALLTTFHNDNTESEYNFLDKDGSLLGDTTGIRHHSGDILLNDSGIQRDKDMINFSELTLLNQEKLVQQINLDLEQHFTFGERIEIYNQFQNPNNSGLCLNSSDLTHEKYSQIMKIIEMKAVSLSQVEAKTALSTVGDAATQNFENNYDLTDSDTASSQFSKMSIENKLSERYVRTVEKSKSCDYSGKLKPVLEKASSNPISGEDEKTRQKNQQLARLCPSYFKLIAAGKLKKGICNVNSNE